MLPCGGGAWVALGAADWPGRCWLVPLCDDPEDPDEPEVPDELDEPDEPELDDPDP